MINNARCDIKRYINLNVTLAGAMLFFSFGQLNPGDSVTMLTPPPVQTTDPPGPHSPTTDNPLNLIYQKYIVEALRLRVCYLCFNLLKS